MSDDKTQGNQEPSNENLDEFKPKSEEEIRSQVVTEYDFDEEVDEERINKHVKERVNNQSKLSVAIKQKQTQRTEKEGYIQKMKDAGLDPETGKPLEKPEAKTELPPNVMTEARYNEIKFQEQLDDLNLDDELKEEVVKVAKLNNLTPKQALKEPYIQYKIEQKEIEEGIDEASLDNKPSGRVIRKSKDIKTIDVTQEDYKTEEGRKKIAEKLEKSSKDMINAGK